MTNSPDLQNQAKSVCDSIARLAAQNSLRSAKVTDPDARGHMDTAAHEIRHCMGLLDYPYDFSGYEALFAESPSIPTITQCFEYVRAKAFDMALHGTEDLEPLQQIETALQEYSRGLDEMLLQAGWQSVY